MNIDGIYSVDQKEEVVNVDEVMTETDSEPQNESEQKSEEAVPAFEVKEEVESEEKPKRKKIFGIF